MEITKEQLNNFWNKVSKRGENDCWEWKGWRKPGTNYGLVRINGRQLRVHRVSWIIKFGEILKGMCVCHHCDNPACVNPKHLFLGTHSDNMRDMWNKGRKSHKGELHPYAKLKKTDVFKIRKMYKGRYGQLAELGRKFDVSPEPIGLIVKNYRWTHLQEEGAINAI
jgi:hypothetical protein